MVFTEVCRTLALLLVGTVMRRGLYQRKTAGTDKQASRTIFVTDGGKLRTGPATP